MGSTRGLHALRNRIPCLKRMLHYCGDEGVLSPLAEAAACHHLFYPCKPPPCTYLARRQLTRALNQRRDPLPNLLRHVCPQIT